MRVNPVKLFLIVLFTLLIAGAAMAQEGSGPDRLDGRELPAGLADLRLDQPLTLEGAAPLGLDPSLQDAEGPQQVIVRLVSPSVAEQKARGRPAEPARQALRGEQQDVLGEVMALDPNARVLAQVQLVLNAVFVEVDASVLDELAAHPNVLRIVPVANYELDLSETVPYIGASAVHAQGFDGSGISVAVLDSGIDYTHAALGGSGNPADYQNNDPTIIEPGTFPTDKVVGGFDFVGSEWPNGPLMPDPDPLDDGPQAGHGTHVGHIIGGVGGVAPAADLYAVKVCSSVSTSCSGIALIQGMEFAVDPDGDGDPSDRVDIINMSLGATYGQPFDDDLSQAVNNATAIGVLTVASAGNGADKPYVNGTPSSAATALSVAQTQVPSASLQLFTVDGVDYPAVFQPWSTPLTSVISAPVQYGDGAGGNLLGCDPFAPGSLQGLIVLVDRGACNFTLKIKNIGEAGGEAGIIGLVAPGAPFAGGDGGDRPIDIPGYMISQADSNAIKAQIGNPGIGTLDPANQLPLVGQMVGSSSRGPQHESTSLIKPEIGAPGASVSAIAGTGTGEGPFGGTSGAAPMVSGSAALLLQAYPHLSPLEAKAMLMNNGETNIDTDPFTGLAPITRIGGGEVRVDRALGAPAAAWDEQYAQGALSFGFVDVEKDTVNLHRMVRVRNYSDHDLEYTITPTFRYDDDAANGAVSLHAPQKVKVRAGRDATFQVKLTIQGELLRGNFMNSGSLGADPSGLTLNEYDGYLILDDGQHPIHMAWHVLPRKASNVVGRTNLNFTAGQDVVDLTNNGVGTAQNDAYSLLATSPDLPEGGLGEQAPNPDIRAVGINTFPVGAGFCSANPSFVWAFAINTWERQEHLLPVSHQVLLDTNQDGTDDYLIINRDLSGFTTISDGRQVTWAVNLATGAASIFFFTEHSMNTGNTVLLICAEQIGMSAADMLSTNVDMSVFAQDFYYGGPGDLVDGLTVTPLGERYFGIPEDIPGKSDGSMTVIDFGPFPGNSPELGVMLVTNGDRGAGNRGGATQSTEALLFMAP
ncbi:MAG TPA: S8 family serine peptidase [Candidatus Sulfomarinibacteraceae bacterium]|nr:S8 family serine peptidase [Candidatus Sulfomarinibacteraceae bacterium]